MSIWSVDQFHGVLVDLVTRARQNLTTDDDLQSVALLCGHRSNVERPIRHVPHNKIREYLQDMVAAYERDAEYAVYISLGELRPVGVRSISGRDGAADDPGKLCVFAEGSHRDFVITPSPFRSSGTHPRCFASSSR